MAEIGLIRCEKNETRCPLTGCIRSMESRTQGFSGYEGAKLVGIFTCRCPGDNLVEMAKILKSKGADTIHFCTCSFSHKSGNQWALGGGFCQDVDALMRRVAEEAGIPCVKGSAHLPEGYRPERFEA